MNRKNYKKIKLAVVFFVAVTVSLAVNSGSYFLAFAGLMTGMVFMAFVRTKAGVSVDERELAIQEKAARLTYSIFAPMIGIGSFLLLMPSRSGLDVFSRGEFVFLDSLGMVLAYLTMFLITVYAVSYYFLGKKYGGGTDE